MNSCELPHRSIWMTGTKKIRRCAHCCMLSKELQFTLIAIQKLMKSLKSEQLEKCASYFKGNIRRNGYGAI